MPAGERREPVRIVLAATSSLLLLQLAGCGGSSDIGAGMPTAPAPPAGTTPPSVPCVTPGVSLTGSSWAPDAVILGCGPVPQSYDAIPQFALAANGAAIAAWTQLDGGRSSVWAIHFSAGRWGAAQLLDAVDSRFVGRPVVSIDAAGNAFVAWPQPTGLWSSRYTMAGGWSMAELLDSGDAGDPRIAADASGNAIAVWVKFGETKANILTRRYTPAGGWGTAELLGTHDDGNAFGPQIAMDGSGNAIAVWHRSEISSSSMQSYIWARRFTPGGGWEAAQQLESNGTALGPGISFDSAGNALATWFTTTGSSNSHWARHYSPGSGWGATQLLYTDHWNDAIYSDFSLDRHGNVIAIWERLGGSRTQFWLNHYSAAGGWGVERELGSFAANVGSSATYPVAAVGPGGETIVVWGQRPDNGEHTDIWFRRHTPAGGWSNATLLETDNRGSAVFPRVAFGPGGNAMAVWSAYETQSATFFAVARAFP